AGLRHEEVLKHHLRQSDGDRHRMSNRIGAGGIFHRLHTQAPMAAAVNDYRTAQSSRFRVHRPVGLGAEVEVDSCRGEKDSAYAELCISMLQLLQRRFGIMHWQ